MFLGKAVQRNLGATKSKAIPACTGGWNAKNSLADMPETDAVILDNYFPDGTKIQQRAGYVSHLTGLTGAVESLMVYSPTSGVQILLAANGGKIYDASTADEAGTPLADEYTSDKWQYINMGTSGGQFLFACNGADKPFTFNGTTIAETTITGPTLINLIWCCTHQNRLWVGEKNSLSAWYGGVNSIGGAFTQFPLYSVAQKGGYIMGMATWTRDGGSGSDDVAVFITSEGEVIVYSGTDPSSASTWSLVGVFNIGKPIGRRFHVKNGGDVVLITEDGFVPLSNMLQVDRSQGENVSISNKIDKALNSSVNQYRTNFGWQSVIYPNGKMMIFNIPTSSTKSVQYVFNTITKAACRFTGQNAACWAVCNDKLFFGGFDGVVYRADYGVSDNLASIVGDVFPAFSYFGSPQNVKSFSLAEVVFEGSAEVSPMISLNVDFNIPTDSETPTSIVSNSPSVWGTGRWGTAIWGGASKIFRKWVSAVGIGRSASLRIRTSTNKTRPSIIAINYIYKIGGFLR